MLQVPFSNISSITFRTIARGCKACPVLFMLYFVVVQLYYVLQKDGTMKFHPSRNVVWFHKYFVQYFLQCEATEYNSN